MAITAHRMIDRYTITHQSLSMTAGSVHRFAGVLLLGLAVAFLSLCLIPTEVLASEWREVFSHDSSARRIFSSALEDYRDGAYARAEQKFRTLIPAERSADEESRDECDDRDDDAMHG